MTKSRLIIFSDLDGTLLDHDNYDWSPAVPAMERLAASDIPVVLNSSKTISEIRNLRKRMANGAPFIVENGAAVVIPANCFGSSEEQVKRFGAPYAEVLSLLAKLREDGFQFCGFNDMSAAEIASCSRLSEAEAELARDRVATEPLLWQGDEDSLALFRQKLEAENCRLVQGGRFFTRHG